MFARSSVIIALASNLLNPSLAMALPVTDSLVPRGGGLPTSNPPGVICYNSWETVTNDPVVQYWYVTAAGAGNSIKADQVWNHLNLNGCAVTENKYYDQPSIGGSALTFHRSEACTADRWLSFG